MYALYVDDKFTGTIDGIEVIKTMGFVLAAKGHKVAYKPVEV